MSQPYFLDHDVYCGYEYVRFMILNVTGFLIQLMFHKPSVLVSCGILSGSEFFWAHIKYQMNSVEVDFVNWWYLEYNVTMRNCIRCHNSVITLRLYTYKYYKSIVHPSLPFDDKKEKPCQVYKFNFTHAALRLCYT